MTRILVVDDEQDMCEILRFNLSNEGFDVYTANSAEDALELLASHPKGAFNLILLDVMMDRMSGFEMANHLRAEGDNTPIIFLTARDHHDDQLTGFKSGADDYITKPFDGKELVARVKAVLRRAQGGEEEKTTDISFPALTVSIAEYDVHYEGKKIEMPPKELEVLYFLASHPNQVFTREQLLRQVWGFDFFGDSRTVDVHIKRVREKLPDSEKYGWSIYTVRGVGYKFSA